MKKNQHGFTLAELLVVIAIVGILVAISIPIFTAQRKKAVIAANQANVRAAKAAAVAMLYGSKESLERYENQPRKQYRYYRYNVKEGKIVCQAEGENAHIEYAQGSGTKKVNDLGPSSWHMNSSAFNDDGLYMAYVLVMVFDGTVFP